MLKTIPDLATLCRLVDATPRPVCGALTPFEIAAFDAKRGAATLRFAAQPAFENHFKAVQGGFAAAMLDAVFAVAGFAVTRKWLPTVEMKLNFIAPLPIADCLGEGWVVRAGKRLAFLEARMLLADGRPAVTASATALIPAD